jgi:hypothetical protein
VGVITCSFSTTPTPVAVIWHPGHGHILMFQWE